MGSYFRKNYGRKKIYKQSYKEEKAGGFTCSHCKKWVIINEFMGTANRNHCNICLWSKHVDEKKGDRKSLCHGGMKPIGLTFKHEGHSKQGEIMLIHMCSVCCKFSINRIAGDDMPEDILEIFELSKYIEKDLKNVLSHEDILLLAEHDRKEIMTQLFGN